MIIVLKASVIWLLLVCLPLASSALWLRSYFAADQVAYAPDARRPTAEEIQQRLAAGYLPQEIYLTSRAYSLVAKRGLLIFFVGEHLESNPTSTQPPQKWDYWQGYAGEDDTPWRESGPYVNPFLLYALDYPYINSEWKGTFCGRPLGFGWFEDLNPGGPSLFTGYTAPCWFLTLLAALPLLCWSMLYVRRTLVHHRRRAQGLCPKCSYDLRASPNRCPECGAPALASAVGLGLDGNSRRADR